MSSSEASSSQLTTPAQRPARAAVRRAVLIRYRVMAYVTAVLLLVLVFVAIPIQIWGHDKTMEGIVGMLHGYLYLVYLVTAFELTVRLRVPLVRMVRVLLAGTVPFGAFFAERWMRHLWEANQREATVSRSGARVPEGA
jgi:integral membrane protein